MVCRFAICCTLLLVYVVGLCVPDANRVLVIAVAKFLFCVVFFDFLLNEVAACLVGTA